MNTIHAQQVGLFFNRFQDHLHSQTEMENPVQSKYPLRIWV